MSVAKNVDYHCPHCQAQNSAALFLEVNAVEMPAVTETLLDGTLFDFECSACQHLTSFDYSMRFIDPERKVCYWNNRENDPLATGDDSTRGLAEDFALRRVEDVNSLKELAHIWKWGLQDLPMLLLKHMMAAQVYQDTQKEPALLNFDSIVRDEGVEWLEYALFVEEDSEPETMQAPFALYENVCAELTGKTDDLFPNGKWVDWTGETARQLWQAIAKSNARPAESGE